VNRAIGLVLFFAGLVHLLPAIGVLGGSQLASLYGVHVDDPAILLLLRHRALLFGVLGAGMIGACFVRKMRDGMLPMALFSTVGFVVLANDSPVNAVLARVMYIDLALSVLLAAALLAHLRSSAISSAWIGASSSS